MAFLTMHHCDEAGIPLKPPSQRVVHKVRARNSCYLTGRSKTQITVLACALAAGYAMPTFVIFDCQTLNPLLTKGDPHMTCLQMVGLTLNGCLLNGNTPLGLMAGWQTVILKFTEFLKSVTQLLMRISVLK